MALTEQPQTPTFVHEHQHAAEMTNSYTEKFSQFGHVLANLAVTRPKRVLATGLLTLAAFNAAPSLADTDEQAPVVGERAIPELADSFSRPQENVFASAHESATPSIKLYDYNSREGQERLGRFVHKCKSVLWINLATGARHPKAENSLATLTVKRGQHNVFKLKRHNMNVENCGAAVVQAAQGINSDSKIGFVQFNKKTGTWTDPNLTSSGHIFYEVGVSLRTKPRKAK
jgi:hypothetical protein